MEGQGKPSFKGLSNRMTLDTSQNPYTPTRTDKLRGFYNRANAQPSGAYAIKPMPELQPWEDGPDAKMLARKRAMAKRLGWL